MNLIKRITSVAVVCVAGLVSLASAAAVQPSADRQTKADAMIARAEAYLRAQQDAESGGWSVPPKGRGQPTLPAISGLVLNGLLLNPAAAQSDPAVVSGAKFILSFRQSDGGIYDLMLPSYNTAICLSALARIDTPEAKAAIKPAQEFLKKQQWGAPVTAGMSKEGPFGTESPRDTDPAHPYYGGVGYGRHSRPDMSNLIFAMQAWHDSGIPADDECMQRALVFLARCQMQEVGAGGKPINDQAYAKGSTQGGFIYSTGKNEQTAGEGETNAGLIEETLDDGTRVSRLRAYGTMSYAGFKGMIYAGLSPSDPRVAAVRRWISENYTLAENPGLGTDGVYYFLLMMARGLDASGLNTIEVSRVAPARCTVAITGLKDSATDASVRAELPALGKAAAIVPSRDGAPALAYFATEADALAAVEAMPSDGEVRGALAVLGEPGVRNWRDDLIDQLARLQNDDGSFRSVDDRWMENNPVLITAYSLIALKHAAHDQRAAR